MCTKNLISKSIKKFFLLKISFKSDLMVSCVAIWFAKKKIHAEIIIAVNIKGVAMPPQFKLFCFDVIVLFSSQH